MTRLEENQKIINILGSYKMDRPWAALVSILCDISQSLAIIADSMEVNNDSRNMGSYINDSAGIPGAD